MHLQKVLLTVVNKYFLDLVLNMYSADLRTGLGTPFDYFHRNTWPLVLGKLFLAPMKNVERTWPERI